jgi:hypothetical protein
VTMSAQNVVNIGLLVQKLNGDTHIHRENGNFIIFLLPK